MAGLNYQAHLLAKIRILSLQIFSKQMYIKP